MKKVIVFGASESSNELYNKISNDYSIVKLCDNDRTKWGSKILDWEVISPFDLGEIEFDYVIIISMSYEEIKEQLVNELEIDESKIVTRYIDYRVISRIAFLKNFAEKINSNPKYHEGSVAEVGVYRGDFAKYINLYFADRPLFLFDTFEGFSKRDIVAEEKLGLSKAKESQLSNTSIKVVMDKMRYPNNVRLKKGYFPDTTEGINDKFVFVNLDVDLYQPTLEGMRFFYPHMTEGGIILIHDYFNNGYNGVRKAVEDFLLEEPSVEDMLFPIGDDMSVAMLKL